MAIEVLNINEEESSPGRVYVSLSQLQLGLICRLQAVL